MYVLADLVLVRATELHKCHVLILPVDQCQDIGLKLKVIKSGVANGSLKEMLRVTQFPLLLHLLLLDIAGIFEAVLSIML